MSSIGAFEHIFTYKRCELVWLASGACNGWEVKDEYEFLEVVMYPVVQFLYIVGCSLALVLYSTSMPAMADGLLVRSKATRSWGLEKAQEV